MMSASADGFCRSAAPSGSSSGCIVTGLRNTFSSADFTGGATTIIVQSVSASQPATPIPASQPVAATEQPACGDIAKEDICCIDSMPMGSTCEVQRVVDTEHLEVNIGDELGYGSFGHVFKCSYRDNLLAVKIKLTTDVADVEVAILTTLAHGNGHPGIVHLTAWRRIPQRMLLFFPLAEQDLSSLMKTLRLLKKKFGREQMYHSMKAMCSAASHMHKHKVLHRDLKPGNILVYRTPTESWNPVIADFGNSLNMGSACGSGEIQLPTHRCCTLRYSAPEVLLPGMVYSFPSDIWSMGLIFTEMEYLHFPMQTDDDVPDVQQLWRVWLWCFSVGCCHPTDSGDSLEASMRRTLGHTMPIIKMKIDLDCGTRIGCLHGAAFAAVVRACVQLEPNNRHDWPALTAMVPSLNECSVGSL